MQFNNNYLFSSYYHSMDQNYLAPSGEEQVAFPSERTPIEGMKLNEVGTSTNPMDNVLNSVQMKIKEGAGRIEFSFMGKGKSNSQAPAPEAFGKDVREDIRALTKINDIQTSTHAALHGESLAGLGREGFERHRAEEALKEIKRAIDFAATATRGGAIVFHTGEWQRPLSEMNYKEDQKMGVSFKQYSDENKDAQYYYVDDRTGQFVGAVSKDKVLYAPEFAKKDGKWIDVQGNPIPDDAPIERLFDRKPVWDEKHTNFKVEEKKWPDFEKEAIEWNNNHRGERPRDAGEMFVITQMQNQILQAKGNSLFHAQQYEEIREARDNTAAAIEELKRIGSHMSEEEKARWLARKGTGVPLPGWDSKSVPVIDYLDHEKKKYEDRLRHIHEASASADAMAKEYEKRIEHLRPIADEGLKRTAETISKAAMFAWEQTRKHKDELNQDIYVAPENYDIRNYGSHPQEVKKIILSSRAAMVDRLQQRGVSPDEAKKLADKHIRATIDIGHLNLWKQHFQPNDNETPDQVDARFKTWVIEQTKDLAEAGVIGHVHLTDNFGYDDEHLTPGQGNAPIKEFIELMREHGLKDFIAEAGSYNGNTILAETWSQFNNPIYGTTRALGFNNMHQGHFGYGAPPFYIVGSYVPSNEWKFWTETPLE